MEEGIRRSEKAWQEGKKEGRVRRDSLRREVHLKSEGRKEKKLV